MADLFVFSGTKWENPVPESGTKILTVLLGSYRVSDFRDFVCSLFPKVILFDVYFKNFAYNIPIGIACV